MFSSKRQSDRRLMLLALIVVEIIRLSILPANAAEDERATTFERVFGISGQLDPAMVKKVKALPPGKRLLVDRDGDGKHDEAWYIDTDTRHTAERRPILVRVVDEDGDLDTDGPDLDSDIYFFDWQADGVIDSVVDYQDNDGDGDVDEMGIYFGESKKPWIDKNKVKVWWSQDIGDDDLLWYDVDGSYEQNGCQYRSHFGGDEVFYQLSLTKGAHEWLNVFEDPFAFYDVDNDGASEVAVRICGVGDDVSSLRYSMDIDNDAQDQHTHDYDFSITALPGKHAIRTDRANTVLSKLRGIDVHPLLSWQEARRFARQATWGKTLLTWDEINANTEENVERDPHERWEGVINHGSANFPQVGGPPTSKFNKRNELAESPATPLRLYYDATDRRLHLLGASKGWLDVDADLDGKVDARYSYIDDNGDGVFDRRQLDLDGDGKIDFDWPMQAVDVRQFELEYNPLHEFYSQSLEDVLAESQIFIDAAKRALAAPDRRPDRIETYFLEKLSQWAPATRLGERVRSTPAGARFYVDLIRDRLFLELSRKFSDHPNWKSVASQYQRGSYAAAGLLIEKLHPTADDNSHIAFRSFTRRIPLQVANPGRHSSDWPVVLNVKDLRNADPEFDPRQCAIVAPERWIGWREIPHQIDKLDDRIGDQVNFLSTLPSKSTTTYYLYYRPRDKETASFPKRTAAAEDWVPPNIGWESNRGAYRAYWGQFDFFGKKTEQLIYDDIAAISYHQEAPWGIDALHVGTTCGLGGLTIYQADKPHRVYNPAGKGKIEFTKRILAQGPIRSVVEFVAKNVIAERPDLAVAFQCLIYHGHQETEIRAKLVDGVGASDGRQPTYLAPGIMKLRRETVSDAPASGCFGTWGWQEDVIGEIGMCVIVAPEVVKDVRTLNDERHIRCRPSSDGRLRYWVIGDWRRGREYPVAPTANAWRRELEQLAALLLQDIDVNIGRPE